MKDKSSTRPESWMRVERAKDKDNIVRFVVRVGDIFRFIEIPIVQLQISSFSSRNIDLDLFGERAHSRKISYPLAIYCPACGNKLNDK